MKHLWLSTLAFLLIVSTGLAACGVTPIPPPDTTPGIGSTRVRETDNAVMVYVPAGEFLMGSADSDVRADSDEKPQHRVTLDAFWIDRTEVSSAQYKKCVRAGACLGDSCSDVLSLDVAPRPIVCVGWDDATAYCQWAGVRLPTEAEWEKAARGTEGWIYPWGSDFDGTLVNYCDKNCEFEWGDSSVDDRSARALNVGMYPEGASPYGALDMAGNVWEIVSDWYSDSYYSTSPTDNPQGPPGQWPVLRGGGWSSRSNDVRTASRYGYVPPYPADPRPESIGFRCAVSAGE